MHDGDVAGEQVGKLRQEQGRAQIAHQPFVEERPALGDLAQPGQDRTVGGSIAFAAGGGDDHVGHVEQVRFSGKAGIAERQTRGIYAGPLPHLHLPLVAFLWNLLVEIQRGKRMHDVWREALGVVGRRIAALEVPPIGVEPFAKARDETDAGDPHLAALRHVIGP